MENGFSVLMICFAGLLLLYAGVLALSKDPNLIPKVYAAKIKNPKAYTVQLAKVIALVATAPLHGGIWGLFLGPRIGAAVVLVGLIVCIWLGTGLMRRVL